MRWEPIDEERYPDYVRFVERGFGEDVDDETIELYRSSTELDRTVVGWDGDRIAATGACYTFELTTEGGAVIPIGGVTDIVVRSTHRGQGLFREVVDRLHRQSAERGEVAQALLASESILYPRFGYGVHTWRAKHRIDTRGLELVPLHDDGTLTEIDISEAHELGPVAWDAYRRVTPGAISGTPGYWKTRIDWKRDGERYNLVHHDVHGTLDGWAVYRIDDRWDDNTIAGSELTIDWIAASTPTAHLALWHHLLESRLVATVTAYAAEDDPVRWSLVEQRRFAITAHHDMTWLRFADTAACLSARRYACDGALVVATTDGPSGRGGTWRIEVTDGVAVVEAAGDAGADLTLDAPDLVAVWSGTARVGALALAGRCRAASESALRTATAMFAVSRSPFCALDF